MFRLRLPTLLLGCALLAGLCCGCASVQTQAWHVPPEPLFIPANDTEFVWERIVDVLHAYPFEIARENKNDLVIETDYKVGASLMEPWHGDAVGFGNRLEGTLQPIRRKVFIALARNEGGFMVTVRADKEISHTAGPSVNTAGGATFQDNRPLQRDLEAVVGTSQPPAGWAARGRDYALEHDLALRIQAAFGQ